MLSEIELKYSNYIKEESTWNLVIYDKTGLIFTKFHTKLLHATYCILCAVYTNILHIILIYYTNILYNIYISMMFKIMKL